MLNHTHLPAPTDLGTRKPWRGFAQSAARMLAVVLVTAACGRSAASTPAPVSAAVPGGPVHRQGTQLPPWAACLFPQNANPRSIARAQPCPAEAESRAVYDVESLLGCWRVTGDDGRTSLYPRFPGRHVRLLPHLSPHEVRAGTSRGGREVVAVGPRPAAGTVEAALRTTWYFAPPDSVRIIHAVGHVGEALTFRARGDTLIGMMQRFTDLLSTTPDTTTDQVDRIRAARVPCT